MAKGLISLRAKMPFHGSSVGLQADEYVNSFAQPFEIPTR
jgi:hypothetical protein